MFSGADIRAEIADQKERLFLWIPVAFGLGIAIYFGLWAEPVWWAGLLAAVAFLPLVVCLYPKHFEDLPHFFGFVSAAGLLLVALGFCAAQVGTWRVGTPVLEKSVGPATIEGRIYAVENLGEKDGARVVLEDVYIEGIAKEKTPRHVRLKFRKDDGLAAGVRLSTLGSLDAPSWPVAPNAYDFRRHLFFQGIGAVGFSYKAATIIGDQTSGVSLMFENLRARIDRTIEQRAGKVTQGIMTALITGQRGAIADEDDEAMRDSGLYHLLSISGTHVTMVAAVLFFFSRLFMAAIPWVALHWPIKKIAAVIALCGAAFYVCLAGADVPATRALLMTGLIMVAIMLDRSPFSLRLIAFAALMVLIFAPYSLVGVSFQMSFAAVAALICFFEWSREWWMSWRSRAGFLRKAVLYLLAVMLTSVIAGTMTGLFSLYHFQSFSMYGVLSNMIVVPLTGIVIMPAAVVAMILMPFGLESWALDIMEWGTVWMLAVAHWTAGLEGAVIHVAQWPVATYGCLIVGTVLFLLWQGWHGKGVALFIVSIGLVLPVFTPAPDILVSGTGKLIAVRDEDGKIYLSSGRKEKFVAENWMRLFGQESVKPSSFEAEHSPLLCDDAGCRTTIHGQPISIVKNRSALEEDCGWAHVMIADVPLREWKCENAKIYDLYDFLDEGAHAFYLSDKGVRVKTVRQDIGGRPWTGGK